MSAALFDAIRRELDDVRYELAETKRKMANIVRSGTVKSFDAKTNTVVADVGFETHDVPYFNHGGTGAHWHPPKKGQQVTLLCSDGDIANAVCLPGGFHDKNAAPSQSADEDIVAERGAGKARLRTTDQAALLEAFQSAFKLEDGKATITAQTIVLDGVVKLGGADADTPASMKGTIDTNGDADVSNLATRVFVK